MRETMISGLYPRSDELIKDIKKFENGKLNSEQLREKLELERESFIKYQKSLNLKIISEPHYNFHDLMRPFSAMLKNIGLGKLTRYFETNTFYRKPEIKGKIRLIDLEPVHLIEFNLPGPYYYKNYKVVIPSPNYFFSLSSFSYDYLHEDFFNDFVEIINEILKAYEPSYIEIVEYPIRSEKKEYEQILKSIKYQEKIIVRKAYALLNSDGKIYENKMPFYSYPFKSSHPVLQKIDTMNTKMENIENLKLDGIITGNENFDFLPRNIAFKKLELLSKLEGSL